MKIVCAPKIAFISLLLVLSISGESVFQIIYINYILQKDSNLIFSFNLLKEENNSFEWTIGALKLQFTMDNHNT